jgi:hypothetical protein
VVVCRRHLRVITHSNTVNSIRAYVLVELRPGKEKDFCEEILEKGLILDSKIERTDFVHGSYDFICILNGEIKDIDKRIIQLRTSPHIRKTETLICFDMFTWDEIKQKVDEETKVCST